MAVLQQPEYKDRSLALTGTGVLLLLVGLVSAFIAPFEIRSFYSFSEGGRFHYAGFGFGSFMFAIIAGQVVAYDLIALLLIPLGYGHLKMRRWIRPYALALVWIWLVVGAPLVVVAFFILAGSKSFSLAGGIAALVFLAASYLVFPWLLIRSYNGRNVRRTLENREEALSWLEALPIPILVLAGLYLFYIVSLHILMLFSGIYPAFGVFRYGRAGFILLDVSIIVLVVLTWGTLRRRMWAWWGGVITVGLFALSTVFTFVRTDYTALLTGLAFPPREMEVLRGIPAQGYHFAILVGLPLLGTWLAVILARNHFRTARSVL